MDFFTGGSVIMDSYSILARSNVLKLKHLANGNYYKRTAFYVSKQ